MGFRPVSLELALPLGSNQGITFRQPLGLGISLNEHGGLLRNLNLPRQAGAFHPARGVDRVAEQLKARLRPSQYPRGGIARVDAEPHVQLGGVKTLRLEPGAYLADLITRVEGKLSQEDGMILDGLGYAGYGDVAIADRAELEDIEACCYLVEFPKYLLEKFEDLVRGAFRAPLGESCPSQ